MSEPTAKARFEFIKSNLFRVVHADGVFGGLTPRGKIFVSFYNERFPIPTIMVHGVKASGELEEEIRSEREGRKAIVREVDVGVEMDPNVAKAVAQWLLDKVEEAEKAMSKRAEEDTR